MSCKHIPEKIETELGITYKCWLCGKNITSLKRRLGNLWIKQRTYEGQGHGYMSWLQGIYTTITTGGVLYIIFGGKNNGVALWILICYYIIQVAFETWIGYMDYHKWKLAQRQNTLGSIFSPTTTETLRILNELREKFIPEDTTPSIVETFKRE